MIEIDTDKVSYEVEANADGIIRGLRGEEGETVPVGATLAYIAAPGEEFVEPEAGSGGAPEVSALTGGGAAPPVTESEPQAPEHRAAAGAVRASPAARRAAAARGLAIESIAGSGPGGRIYLSDVLEADVRQRQPEEAPVVAPPAGRGEETAVASGAAPAMPATAPEPVADGGAKREPLSRVRRVGAPQAAILALGRVRTVPEWQDGEWLPRRIVSTTLSIDHRVADGADGARFLQDLQEALLSWELLL